MQDGPTGRKPGAAAPARPGHDQGEYRRVLQSAGTYRHEVSMLRLTGKDAPDFLHRLSTNDLSRLSDGQARKTILVNEKGRIIELVHICAVTDSVLLVGSPGNGGKISDWLGKFIIMEDVTVSLVGERVPCVSVLGPEGPEYLGRLVPGYEQSAPDVLAAVSVGGMEGLLFRDDRCMHNCSLMVFPGYADGERAGALPAIPPGLLPEPISAGTFETLRIEEGIPLTGRELTASVNPLEAGLKKYISFTKGCYIGQEVIARLDTYNKVSRLLSLFLLPGMDGGVLPGGGRILVGESDAGLITSTCYSPRFKGTIGLGFRRRGMPREGAVFIPDGSAERHPVSLLAFTIPGYERYEVTDEDA